MVTVIKPSLSPAQDSCLIESTVSVDADKSLMIIVASIGKSYGLIYIDTAYFLAKKLNAKIIFNVS